MSVHEAHAADMAPQEEQFARIEVRIEAIVTDPSQLAPAAAAAELVALAEQVLEAWIRARGLIPTNADREGFRLLALHRQGAKGDPSFNACRETCRELAYHFNLITGEPDHPQIQSRITLAAMVALHLCLFVGGKMKVEGLGDFCCASRPLRAQDEAS